MSCKMDYNRALEILQIKEDFDNPVTIEIIKKKYKMGALIYHPDQNAYEYLMKYFNLDMEWKGDEFTNNSHPSFHSYKDLLTSFLKNVIDEGGIDLNGNFLLIIIHKLTQLCELKAFEFIEKLDKELLIKIYDVLYRYYNVFRISEDFLLKIRKVLDSKLQNDSCIILHPSLDDLLSENVYRLAVDDKLLWIPLWHHELIYDISGSDLYVRCFPILPETVIINENNDIIVKLKYAIQDILNIQNISFKLANKEFSFPCQLMFIKPYQKIYLKEKGIPCIDIEDVYNISKRGCIIAEIELY